MKHDISKYIISSLLLVFGLVALVSYISGLMGDGLESQPHAMLLAALSLIGVGVIALPEVLDKLDAKKYKSIMMAGVVLALGLGYAVIYSISEEIEFRETKQKVEAQTIQQLKDIREIQLAHKSVRGTYAPDFDSLAIFVHADVMPVTFNMGSFHDTLNENRSAELGYIIKRADLDSIAIGLETTSDSLLKSIEEDNSPYKIRDTLYTSFFAENFTDEARAGAKLPKFDLEAMSFNPRTGERFVMSTSAVEVGGLWQPTIVVQDPTPFGREKVKKDTLRFGSLTEAHTDGNWRN
tara:strand:+ start:214 stop:1095 length:882 start_codon:yes stop_codon:yes gene_type:complete